tara:strand:- start:381 stop:626 length:246 start_codon:yes stop_codon:yes gene_type:complete
MSDDGCSYKRVTDEEIKRTEYANNSSAGEVYLSPDRQEEIKKLMFSALIDPREKYKKITVDEMTNKWIPVDTAMDKTKDSN